MATTLPPVPNPPPPQVQRIDAQGRPTVALVTYEADMLKYLKALKAAVEAM